tara:strand:- start:196 stop:690 length:495 start_codon:yes stop_codon:yes gene_type:complete
LKKNNSKTTNKVSIRALVKDTISSQDQKTVTVLSSLLSIEKKIQYIPDEAIEEIAEYCNVSINDVWSVASFYTNFRFTPPGEKILDICWGPTCHLLGSQKIIKSAIDQLGISEEGETTDKKFTVRYNTCLGACAQGPCVSINHKVIGFITPDKIKKLLLDLSNN